MDLVTELNLFTTVMPVTKVSMVTEFDMVAGREFYQMVLLFIMQVEQSYIWEGQHQTATD